MNRRQAAANSSPKSLAGVPAEAMFAQIGANPPFCKKPYKLYPGMKSEVRDIDSHIIKHNVWRGRLVSGIGYKTAADYVTIPDWLDEKLHEVSSFPEDNDISKRLYGQTRIQKVRELYEEEFGKVENETDNFKESLAYLTAAAGERSSRLKGRMQAIYRKEGIIFEAIRGEFDMSETNEKKLKFAAKQGAFGTTEEGLIKVDAYKDFCREQQGALDKTLMDLAKSKKDIYEESAHQELKDQLAKAAELHFFMTKKFNDAIKESVADNPGLYTFDRKIENNPDPSKRTGASRTPTIATESELESLLEKRKVQLKDVLTEIHDVYLKRKSRRKLDIANSIREIMCQPWTQVSKIGATGWVAYNTATGVAYVWGVDPKEYPNAFQKFEKFAHDRGDFWRGMVEVKGPPEFVTSFETYCRERSMLSKQLFGHPEAFLLSEITQEVTGSTEANYGRGAVVMRVLILDKDKNVRYDQDGKPMIMNLPFWNKKTCDATSTPHPKSMMVCFEASKHKNVWPRSTKGPGAEHVVNPYGQAGESKVAADFAVYIPMDDEGKVIDPLSFESAIVTCESDPDLKQKIRDAQELLTQDDIDSSQTIGGAGPEFQEELKEQHQARLLARSIKHGLRNDDNDDDSPEQEQRPRRPRPKDSTPGRG